MKINNPVLPGFNADPSIIRVDDIYYIANSTFEWFPGVQIHESKDLINWRLIAHPLDTCEVLDMKGNPDSGGVWAPDLSYANGKFWLVYTDVKVTEGSFKDCHNYLITADDIRGPWSKPISLTSSGFDASLFHDDDGKKYLLNMVWDHREYNHPFYGIQLTEYSVAEQKLLRSTSKIIYKGTHVKLTEGPHVYKIFDYYYLFCAEGGTVFTHQEVVARSKNLFGPYETQPGEAFITNVDSPDHYIQKSGHGSLVQTQSLEWYFAHLMSRPWNRSTESAHDPRGWSTLGRETGIQKVEWDDDKWPHIVGGKAGQRYVDAPANTIEHKLGTTYPTVDHFDSEQLNINFQTLRIPFSEHIGSLTANPGHLRLYGIESLTSLHTQATVARRWQAFYFDAATSVKYNPTSFQQFAGLVNYYNTRHWSCIHLTWNEEKGRVIEILQANRDSFNSYLQQNVILVPDNISYVHFKTKVRKETYTYEYSFDGDNWIKIPFVFDAAILSDDYVVQSYGGFFTGAFVGMTNVDQTGEGIYADFDYFEYRELDK